jgi:hypothetical protein
LQLTNGEMIDVDIDVEGPSRRSAGPVPLSRSCASVPPRCARPCAPPSTGCAIIRCELGDLGPSQIGRNLPDPMRTDGQFSTRVWLGFLHMPSSLCGGGTLPRCRYGQQCGPNHTGPLETPLTPFANRRCIGRWMHPDSPSPATPSSTMSEAGPAPGFPHPEAHGDPR